MSQTYIDEINEQPEGLLRLTSRLPADLGPRLTELRAAIDSGQIDQIVITGMGGSLFSAYGTWLRLSNALPVPVVLWDASELTQQAFETLRPRTAVIAISQSGESVELRRLAESRAISHSISLTNTKDNTLSRWATLPIATDVGPESTVSTKTYNVGLAALYAVEAGLLGRLPEALSDIERLSETVRHVLAQSQSSADQILAFVGHANPITFIGRGASFGSASMAALVTAEAAKAPTQALSGGQFRHGPLELVREGFTAIMFMGNDGTRQLNERTVADISRFGGKCLVLDPSPNAAGSDANIMTVPLPDVPAPLLPIIEILPIQLLMVPMAKARGFEPAQFLNGSKVTAIE